MFVVSSITAFSSAYVRHIDRPALLLRPGCSQADLQGSPGVGQTDCRWLITLDTVDEVIDLSAIGRRKAFLKPGHNIMAAACPGKCRHGRITQVPYLQRTLAAPNLTADVVAVAGVAAGFYQAQATPGKVQGNYGIIYVANPGQLRTVEQGVG